MAVLLVSHDLASVARHADRVVVMRKGRVVESGAAGAIFQRPRADYTRDLVAATPRLDTPVPSLSDTGAHFVDSYSTKKAAQRMYTDVRRVEVREAKK